jgi:DNA modification methylase
MSYLTEDHSRLPVVVRVIATKNELTAESVDVLTVVLPSANRTTHPTILQTAQQSLAPNGTLVVVGEIPDLVYAHTQLEKLNYQLWVSLKRTHTLPGELGRLPNQHFGAVVYTQYQGTLKHSITRVAYTYCPACDKTTKDYGGKKHTYNSYGTLISDVWRDETWDLQGDLSSLWVRLADLFGLPMYKQMQVWDCHLWKCEVAGETTAVNEPAPTYGLFAPLPDPNQPTIQQLYHGDSLTHLRQLPSESIDFAFIDPPYNLGKQYNSYGDDLAIQTYFNWCDEWIDEASRLLRPGRTLALLNIPLWAIRHFLHMDKGLVYQNWITWDALSFPVRKIMPAHYTILCFSKGQPRMLPGLMNPPNKTHTPSESPTFDPLRPMQEGYCLRSSCVKKRNAHGFTDRDQLTDVWSDIHRLKHNSRRVDHPCQLPPELLYRLITLFTYTGETVLDCFNGAGTTTLAAHQLGRGYVGIELSDKYYGMAVARHEEIRQGLNPFRKEERTLTEKNNNVPRMSKQVYKIPKKTLQLEVRRVAQQLERLPTREDMIAHGQYPIFYYDEYFASWGEVCAAARHDGMSETKPNGHHPATMQLGLFDKGLLDAKR